ncbi:MazG family protein [Amycolatopsis sp. NPDC059657]|uniref:MazG family protein n=1 Tax=Amycolatopsis sp. NPDC059657 TaxID=3346899 RepID=UPI00366BB326
MTVVLTRDGVLSAEALAAVRAADAVYSTVPTDGLEPAPNVDKLLTGSVVLLTASVTDPSAAAMIAAGSRVIEVPVQGSAPALVEAVAVMDRLRSPGGCPWDAAQTHESLRQYLVEETYELLDAIETGDRAALREELGDVLLQVLFHARVAAEDPADPFDVDDVARDLVGKLVGRHPNVFAGADRVHTAEHQELKWEELKQAEKRRQSIVDGVALGQPAVALAGKLGQRSGRAGIPLDLFPGGTSAAEQLFRIAATARRAGVDPEGELRAVAKSFAADLRAAEDAARLAGVEPSALEADGWRRFWPSRPS